MRLIFQTSYLVGVIIVLQAALGEAKAGSFLDVHGSIAGGCSFSLELAIPVSDSCGGSFVSDPHYAVLGSDLSALASYNSLKAYAFQDIEIESLIDPKGLPITSDALATAFNNDYISLPSSFTHPAYVTFGWTADGLGHGNLTLAWGTAACSKQIISSSATCTSTREIFPGQKYNLEIVLTADASVQFSGFPGDELSQTSDFTHTALLTDVEMFDQSMDPLTGVQLVSDSGFDYQDNVLSAAPEPGCIFLLMLGAAVIVGLAPKGVPIGARRG